MISIERVRALAALATCVVALIGTVGCSGGKAAVDPKAEAPPPAKVEHEGDPNFVKVDKPDQFKLVTTEAYFAPIELNVTGSVSPDVSRTVPAISLASGRVIEVKARLGDSVTKGQLLLRVQSADVSQAYSDYQQAIADEKLAKAQYDRAKTLYDKGAIAQKDLETAVDAEIKAEVTSKTTLEHLKVLGVDEKNPSAIVDVRAPITGVITDQQVVNAAGVQGLASPNPFTISDLSYVWVLCDVYENDLPLVKLGDYADVKLNAYPNQIFKGRVGNISPTLDPNTRTAKVRLEMRNPGQMRLGMFVTATFRGLKNEQHAAVPSSAVLHLHDRDWVYAPEGSGFRRISVVGGAMLPGNRQEILSGVGPGQRLVRDALVLQNTVEQ